MKKDCASRFKELDSRRQSKLERSYEFAELTIPGLLPREGHAEENELPVPYSSQGAKNVTSLAARIVSAHYPLNGIPFFNFSLTPKVENSDGMKNKQLLEKTKALLSEAEQRVMAKINETNYRQALYMAFQHLIVIGDCLLHLDDDYSFRVYRLDQYVVRRGLNGKPIEIIVQEWVDADALPPNLEAVPPGPTGAVQNYGSVKREAVYTKMVYDHDRDLWDVYKEFRGQTIEEGKTFKVLPFFALRWTSVTGENYGRSLVEENNGDLRVLDGLTKALIEGSAANSFFVPLVDPTGMTNIDDLDEAENGKYCPGRDADVTIKRLGSEVQLQVTQQAMTLVAQELGETFLRNASAQPTGDRVTATIVRVIASELEQSLGGVFSTTSLEIQPPVVKRILALMERDGLLQEGFLGLTTRAGTAVSLKIRSGLEALGREVENSKLTSIVEDARSLPPDAMRYIKWDAWWQRRFVSMGIDPEGLLLTSEEIAQMQAEQQQAALREAAQMQAMQTGANIVEQGAAQAMSQQQ